MRNRRKWENIGRKVICIITLSIFIISNIGYGATDFSKSHSQEVEKSALAIDTLAIPRDYGIIKERANGGNGKLVLYIQDAHCNYEAQNNISKILEYLIKNYKIDFVAVEGADGIVDTSWFKAFPDEDIKREVADYFMKKGEITGAEFLSITSDLPFTIYGAEDRKYYIDNLNSFLDSYPHKEEFIRYYTSIKSALGKLKNYIYTSELRDLDNKTSEHKDKKIKFADYVGYLNDLAAKKRIDIKNYQNFSVMIEALKYEKNINFDIVNDERAVLIDELSKKLSKEKLTELVNRSLEFKLGKIEGNAFYSYLAQLAEENDITLSKNYENLARYIVYSKIYAKIDNEKLFDEIDVLVAAIKDTMFQNDDQRTLDTLWKNVTVILGFINIELTNKEYDYYSRNKENFGPAGFISFINKYSARFGLSYNVDIPDEELSSVFTKLIDFYEIALKRDEILVNNMFKGMKGKKTDVAVLITGGFHTKGVTKFLKEENASYVVISPSITQDAESPYIAVLTGQKTPFEELLLENSASREGNLLAVQLISELLLEERDRTIREHQIERVEDFRREFVREYVQRWFNRALAEVGRIGLETEVEIKQVLLDSITVAIRKVNRDRRQTLIISPVEEGLITGFAEAEFDRVFQAHTMKTPFTDALSPREKAEFALLIDKLKRDRKIEEVSLNEQGGVLLSFIDNSRRTTPIPREDEGTIMALLNAISEGRVILRVCDLGTEEGFARFLKVDRYTYLYSREEDGKLVIYTTKAFARLVGLPGNRNIDESMSYIMAQGIMEEYLEWKKGKNWTHRAAHDFLKKGYLWSQEARDRGVSDRDLYIYNHAVREGDMEYFKMVLSAYETARDPEGKLKKIIDHNLTLLLFIHFTDSELEAISKDLTQNEELRNLAGRIARGETRPIADDAQGVTARLGHALEYYRRTNDISRLSKMLEEYAKRVRKGEVDRAVFKEGLRRFLSVFPALSKGWLEIAIGEISGIRNRSNIRGVIKELVEETRTNKKVVRLLPVGPRGTRYGQSTTGRRGNQKPFVETIRTDEQGMRKSFLRLAIERALSYVGLRKPQGVFVVTDQSILGKVERALSEFGVTRGDIFGEPQGANTAAVMGIAAVLVGEKYGYDTVISAMTTDHDIPELGKLGAALDEIETQVALEPLIGILGIRPPPGKVDTSMGHVIRTPANVLGNRKVYNVLSFREKPEPSEAEQLTGEGAVWNSGKFIFRASTVLEAFRRFQPEYYEGLMRIRNALLNESPENANAIIREVYKQFAKANKPFEKAVVEPAAGPRNERIAVDVTIFDGAWTDLGNSYQRYIGEETDGNGNILRVPRKENVELVGTSNSNIEINSTDVETRVHVYGLDNTLVMYDDVSNKVIVTPMQHDFVLGYLYNAQMGNNNLRKYVVVDEQNPRGSPRNILGVIPKNDRGNRGILGNEGDILILDSRDMPISSPERAPFCDNENITVYSEGGLTAVAGLRDVIVIRKGRDVYVYGPRFDRRHIPQGERILFEITQETLILVEENARRDLQEFKRAKEAGSLTEEMTKALAKRAADNFFTYYDLSGAILRNTIELVASIGSLPEDRLSKPAIGSLFGRIVEGLYDRYNPEDREAYYKVFSQVIAVARHTTNERGELLEEARALDERLFEYGIPRGLMETEEALVQRNALTRRDQPFDTSRRESIKKIFIPSRVTIGADINLTSMLIKRALEVFPNAEIVLIGSPKLKGLFEGHPRVRVAEVSYERRGGLLSRLGSWFALLDVLRREGFDEETSLFVDANSRLLQCGLLPVAKNDVERGIYYDFAQVKTETPSNVQRELEKRIERVFPSETGHAYSGLFLVEKEKAFAAKAWTTFGLNERYTVSMSIGVGGNWDKSVTGEEEEPTFEAALADRIISGGNVLILDRAPGYDFHEERKVVAIENEQAKKGTVVVEYATLPNGETIMLPAGHSEIRIAEKDEKGKPLVIEYTYKTAVGEIAAQWVEDTRRKFDKERDLKVSKDIDRIQRELVEAFKQAERAMIVSRGSVARIASLIEKSEQYVGYDSFAQHIANAVGVPLVTIFAGWHKPDFPDLWRPYGTVTSEVVRVDNIRLGRAGINEEAILEEAMAKVTAIKKDMIEGMESATRSANNMTPHEDVRIWGRRDPKTGRLIGELHFTSVDTEAKGYDSTLTLRNGIAVTLGALIGKKPEDVLGPKVVERWGKKPILCKLEMPGDRERVSDLSTQVHPVKNELWVITKPGELLLGLSEKKIEEYRRRGGDWQRQFKEDLQKLLTGYQASVRELISALLQEGYEKELNAKQDAVLVAREVEAPTVAYHLGRVKALEAQIKEFFNRVSVKKGDVVKVPVGTLHAILHGVELIEPQIEGVTYRLEDGTKFDAGSRNRGYMREWHIGEAIAAMNVEPYREEAPQVISSKKGIKVERLGEFAEAGLIVDRITLTGRHEIKETTETGYHVLAVAEGQGVIEFVEAGEVKRVEVREGQQILIPHKIGEAGEYTIKTETELTIVKSYPPVEREMREAPSQSERRIRKEEEQKRAAAVVQEGKFVVGEVAQALGANMSDYKSNPTTVFVQKSMGFRREKEVSEYIKNLYGDEYAKNLRIVEFTLFEELKGLIEALPQGHRHAIVADDQTLGVFNPRNPQWNDVKGILANSPILPVKHKDVEKGKRLLYRTELLATAIMAANTTLEDIANRHSRAISLHRAIVALSGKKELLIDDLKGLLSAEGTTNDAVCSRLRRLIEELLLNVPIEAVDMDRELNRQRTIDWAA